MRARSKERNRNLFGCLLGTVSWNNERKGKKTSISGCFWLAEAAEAANKICNLV